MRDIQKDQLLRFLEELLEKFPQEKNGNIAYVITGSLAMNILLLGGIYEALNEDYIIRIESNESLIRKIGDVDILRLYSFSYPPAVNIADFLENKEILKDKDHLKFDAANGKGYKHFGRFKIRGTNISVYIMDPRAILTRKLLSAFDYLYKEHIEKNLKDLRRYIQIYKQIPNWFEEGLRRYEGHIPDFREDIYEMLPDYFRKILKKSFENMEVYPKNKENVFRLLKSIYINDRKTIEFLKEVYSKVERISKEAEKTLISILGNPIVPEDHKNKVIEIIRKYEFKEEFLELFCEGSIPIIYEEKYVDFLYNFPVLSKIDRVIKLMKASRMLFDGNLIHLYRKYIKEYLNENERKDLLKFAKEIDGNEVYLDFKDFIRFLERHFRR